jgi:hypothetical protein
MAYLQRLLAWLVHKLFLLIVLGLFTLLIQAIAAFEKSLREVTLYLPLLELELLDSQEMTDPQLLPC